MQLKSTAQRWDLCSEGWWLSYREYRHCSSAAFGGIAACFGMNTDLKPQMESCRRKQPQWSGSSKFIKQTNKTQSLGTFRLKEQNHWKKKKGFHASKNTTIIKILLLAKHRLTRTTETEKQNRIQRSIVLFYKRENHQRLLLLQPYAEVPAVVGWSRTCSAPGSREGGK